MTTPYQEKARDQESEEAFQQRLVGVRARRRQRLALETAEERQTRLSRRRVRLTAEMAEERETQVRLNLQVNQPQRLETEAQDMREARLHELRVSQKQRFAAKEMVWIPATERFQRNPTKFRPPLPAELRDSIFRTNRRSRGEM